MACSRESIGDTQVVVLDNGPAHGGLEDACKALLGLEASSWQEEHLGSLDNDAQAHRGLGDDNNALLEAPSWREEHLGSLDNDTQAH